MRSLPCHELNIIISITIMFIEIDCISISALRSFAMQLPFVLLFVGYMGMASPLISSMLSSLSFCYSCLFIRLCSLELC